MTLQAPPNTERKTLIETSSMARVRCGSDWKRQHPTGQSSPCRCDTLVRHYPGKLYLQLHCIGIGSLVSYKMSLEERFVSHTR